MTSTIDAIELSPVDEYFNKVPQGSNAYQYAVYFHTKEIGSIRFKEFEDYKQANAEGLILSNRLQVPLFDYTGE